MRCAVAALITLLLTGCAISHETSGRAPAHPGAALTVGQSTEADALVLLGPPRSVHRQFDGELLVWRADVRHTERLLLIPFVPIYERFVGDSRSDTLALLFDRSGRLAGVGETRHLMGR